MAPVEGIKDLREGFRLALSPGLRLFVVIPLVINVLLYALMGWWAIGIFQGWIDSALAWLPEWLAFIEWLLWLLLTLLFMFVMVYTFVFVATLVGAPFYAILAEQTQRKLTGHTPDAGFNAAELLRMLPKTVWREIQKVLSYLPGLVLLIIIGFIPVLNVIAPLLWVIFSAWIMAFEFLDYPADHNGCSIPELKRLMRRNRSRSMSFGLAAWALTLIPVINLVVMQAAVCGGVRQWLAINGADANLKQSPMLR